MLDDLNHRLFKDFETFDDAKEKSICDSLSKITEMLPPPVVSNTIQITIQEKEMIVKAFGFNKGHWYKCPNGHAYLIIECGGATQRSNCQESKEEIGKTMALYY